MPQKRLSRNDNGQKKIYSGNKRLIIYGETARRASGDEQSYTGKCGRYNKAGDDSCVQETQKRKLSSKLILQVHDELIVETAAEEKEAVISLLTECMENVMEMSVKLSVGVSSGRNWYELK